MTISVTHSTPADSSFSSTGATAWNADHTLTGVGTVAEQNANAVAITGGNIDGTVIGNTTPAAGTFTTLTATGQTSLGGAAGVESVRVNTTGGSSGSNNYVDFYGTFGSGDPLIASGGTGANAGLGFRIKGSGAYKFATANTSSNVQFQIANTASAVNYVQVTGAATGGSPAISAQGSDANATLALISKGSNPVQLQNASTVIFQALPVTSAVNYLRATNAITGFGAVLSAIGSDTNIPLVFQPKGTGALQAQQTDSTATGGNARGANAVDWQTSRSNAARVASGSYTVVGGGNTNSATAYSAATLGGESNQATGNYSVVGGGSANTSSGVISTISGGQLNTAAGYFNFIGGGFTNSGTSGSAVTTQSGTMNGTTAVTLSGSNANIKVGQYITGTSIAGDTYVSAISGTSLTLSKVASGSSTSTLSFYTPHGVVVGGGNNQATGSYSFIGGGGDAGTAGNRNVASGDWSVVAGGQKNTSSGTQSFVGGGNTNSATSTGTVVAGGLGNNSTGFGSSLVGGNGNISNSTYSFIAGGQNGATRGIAGLHTFPACVSPVANSNGVSQASLLILGRQTTDATATVLCSDSNAAGTTNQVILPNNSAYYFKGTVVAGVTGGGNTKGWTVEGVIKRGANAASTAIVGTATVLSAYADAGAATWALTATADTTNGGLAITFTGQAGTTIRTVAKIETTEMTY